MKAMIFAAGLGTRLRPFTLENPKALVPLKGVPMLERVIRRIGEAGISDIVVNVHHFASKIEKFLKNNHNFGLNISISHEEDQLLDTGGGLLAAKELIRATHPDEPILLYNADIYSDFSLDDMIDAHIMSGADVTLLCSHRHSSRTLYFKNDRLIGWQNLKTEELKPAGFMPNSAMEESPFGGIHIVTPSIFPLLESYDGGEHKSFSIVPFYLDNIDRLNIRQFLLPAEARWFDVGSSEKLAAAEATF